MKTPVYTVKLTTSQRMALMSLLIEAVRTESMTQRFIDCSVNPSVETTTTDLLQILIDSKFIITE